MGGCGKKSRDSKAITPASKAMEPSANLQGLALFLWFGRPYFINTGDADYTLVNLYQAEISVRIISAPAASA